MLGFWIKPRMSLDAWFGSVKTHEEGEIVGEQNKLFKVQGLW
jgi:hypothetical protein